MYPSIEHDANSWSSLQKMRLSRYNSAYSSHFPTRLAANNMTSIEYRELTTNEEYFQLGELEIIIWDLPAREAVSNTTLHVLHHTGGCVLGAYDGDKMIGFAFGFAMHKEKRLWSHVHKGRFCYKSCVLYKQAL